MKKITSLLVLIILSSQLSAQMFSKKIKGNGDITTTNRTVENYDKIGIGGAFYVTLLKGKEGSITIKAQENLLPYIITEVKNGELNIKTKDGYQIQSNKKIEITIPFEEIDAISLAGSGHVNSKDIVNTNNLKLSLAGSGSIQLEVATNTINSNIAGSGNIQLNGETSNLTCSIAGSGNVNAYDLKSDISTIKIAGSGNAKVNAVNEIHGSTAGSGNIIYSGNPTIVKVKSAGSGSIKKRS